MLRACRRTLRPGGVLALTTIELSPGLTPAQRRRIAPAAPRAVASRRPYPELLAAAGFHDIGDRDLSDEYLRTTLAWLHNSERERERLYVADGHDAVEEKLQGWRDEAVFVRRGLLRRTLYWGRR